MTVPSPQEPTVDVPVAVLRQLSAEVALHTRAIGEDDVLYAAAITQELNRLADGLGPSPGILKAIERGTV